MRRSTLLASSFAFTAFIMTTAVSSAAVLSLDTVGSDPDLTSPNFSFTVGPDGGFSSLYRNVSQPAMDFISLRFEASFSKAFFDQLTAKCDGGTAFTTCQITFEKNINTLVFDFFGTDSAHPGVPYEGNPGDARRLGVSAVDFEAGRTVGTTGVSVLAVTIPEPGAFSLAGLGILSAGLLVLRKNFLKFRVRS